MKRAIPLLFYSAFVVGLTYLGFYSYRQYKQTEAMESFGKQVSMRLHFSTECLQILTGYLDEEHLRHLGKFREASALEAANSKKRPGDISSVDEQYIRSVIASDPNHHANGCEDWGIKHADSILDVESK